MTDVERQERSAALKRLDAFVGKWTIKLDFPAHEDHPGFSGEAPGSFEWLDKDKTFLVYRAGVEGSGFPVGYCLIGGDDNNDNYSLLYSDSRGVARIYQMSFTDGVWKQWRDDPSAFSQRFSATFSPDGRTITGQWDINEDGTWNKDFDITYTKVD